MTPRSDSTVDITVAICTRNRAELLRTALASLINQQTDGQFTYEIVVVDNASTDHTPQVVNEVSAAAPSLIRYVHEPQLGRVFARNRGIQEARGQWIASFDDDEVADPHWLQQLLALANEKKLLSVGGAVALRLPSEWNRPIPWVCRRLLGESAGWPEPRPYTRKEGPGCGNHMLHRSAYQQVGLYNHTFNSAGEDTDLYRRLRAAGIETWFTPHAVVWHLVPADRLAEKHLRAVSVEVGNSFAKRDYNELGRVGLALMLLARIGQAACLILPRWLWARLRRATGDALAARCLLWRMRGYCRASVSMIFSPQFKEMKSGSIHPRPDNTTRGINGAQSMAQPAQVQSKTRLKILVVGQTPPPWHGQAIMIDRLLRAPYERVRLYRVRMAFSDSIGDVGRFRLSKVFHLVSVIAQIVYHRLVHGAKVLYYPPAGPNRVPLYRDLVILLCSRWMFRRTIFHFHAGGISELYPQLSRTTQWLFRKALFDADAGIRVSHGSPPDAVALAAQQEFIVPNGIDDEWPKIEAYRMNRVGDAESVDIALAAFAGSRVVGSNQILSSGTSVAVCESQPLQILFVGILRESKGLLVLIEACGQLAQRGVPFELRVVGQIQSPEFEVQVKGRIEELELQHEVEFLGPLGDDAKWRAYANADVLCLPTFYEAETFAIVLVEAMCAALPVVATRWRGIPEIVEEGKTGYLAPVRDWASIADRLEQLQADPKRRRALGLAGREKFLREYTVGKYWTRMEEVFTRIGEGL